MSSATRPTATAVQTFVSAAQTDLPKAIRDRFGTTSVQDTQLSSPQRRRGVGCRLYICGPCRPREDLLPSARRY